MPTYDYECPACDHRFEHFQKITDDPLVTCPKCKKKKLVRLFGTGAAVVFKGSGFYQTDYRSENYKKGADKDKSSSDPKSGESKPAEKKSGDSQSKSDTSPPPESKSSSKSDGRTKKKRSE